MTMTQADRPTPPARPQRRSFAAEQKAEFVRGYEACPEGRKGAYLREHGLYSGHITKWRAPVSYTHLDVYKRQVKTYVSRLFTKLELRDRVQAVVLAYESGLVQPGSARAVDRPT